MRVISLTYKYDRIKLSLELALFFRTMGIYVVEKFYEPKVNMQEDVDLLRSDFSDVSLSAPFSDYDAEIYLMDNLDELKQMGYTDPLKRIVVLYQRPSEKVDENTAFIGVDESTPGFFPLLLYDILQAMQKQNLLDKQEYDDCCICADIYGKDNFSQILYQIGYSRLNEEKLNLWKEQYDTTIDKMFGTEVILSDDRSFWKQSKHKHTCFALLSIQYNMNIYADQQKQKKVFDSKELLRYAMELEHNDDLNSEVKRLIGDIYFYLLGQKNKAYDYYLKSCLGNQNYNCVIFFKKGIYQQAVTGDFDYAKRYYYKSLLINPDYYCAWYNLGYCFYQQGDVGDALTAFYALRKLLEIRLESCNISPFEVKLYFKACNTCAKLLYNRFANFDRAIEFYQEAEKAWEVAKKSSFWELLGQDAEDSVNLLLEGLDILSVYNSLIRLYEMSGTASLANQYRAKKQEILQRRRGHE